MSKSIRVEPAKLTAAATQIDNQAAEYKKLYEQLYTEVDAMKSAWQGSDNVAFTTQIAGFKDDFEAMYKLMIQYSEFLKSSATTYSKTQDEVVSQAKKLVN